MLSDQRPVQTYGKHKALSRLRVFQAIEEHSSNLNCKSYSQTSRVQQLKYCRNLHFLSDTVKYRIIMK